MIGLFKAKACNRNVAGFFVLLRRENREAKNAGKNYRGFSLRSSRFLPPSGEIEGVLPPKQLIQLIFFKFKISGLAICSTIGYGAVKEVFN
jgi:hypothetical protein